MTISAPSLPVNFVPAKSSEAKPSLGPRSCWALVLLGLHGVKQLHEPAGQPERGVFLERDGGAHQCELIMINDEALVQTKSLSTQLSHHEPEEPRLPCDFGQHGQRGLVRQPGEDGDCRSSGPLSGLLDTCSLLQPAQFFVKKRLSEKSEVLVTVSVLEAKSCGAETVPELVTSPQTTLPVDTPPLVAVKVQSRLSQSSGPAEAAPVMVSVAPVSAPVAESSPPSLRPRPSACPWTRCPPW